MDTPRAVVVHKKNVHIGGGKATLTMKPDKLKTAKTAGKKRKALEDLPVVMASKDVNLKQKSTRKGNKVKKSQMAKGKQSKSVLQGFGKGNKPLDHISIDEEIIQCSIWAHFRHRLSDEQIKECYEWAKDELEGTGGIEEIKKLIGIIVGMRSESSEYKKPKISTKMVIPGSKFGEPFTSEEKGYEKDETVDFKISVPGRLSSVDTQEELDINGLTELFLEYDPLLELKLNDGLSRI